MTHQLQYLPRADRVVVMEGGRVVAQGAYEDCLDNEVFAHLLAEHNSHAGEEAAAGEAAGGEASTAAADGAGTESDGTPPLVRTTTRLIEARAAEEAVDTVPGALGRADMEVRDGRGASLCWAPACSSCWLLEKLATSGGGAWVQAARGVLAESGGSGGCSCVAAQKRAQDNWSEFAPCCCTPLLPPLCCRRRMRRARA